MLHTLGQYNVRNCSTFSVPSDVNNHTRYKAKAINFELKAKAKA